MSATSIWPPASEAERTLMRGFTTVRDLGGPAFALKQAIDEGLVPGPRIYPSGAMITATGGHGDLRPLSDLPSVAGTLSRVEQIRRQHHRRWSGRRSGCACASNSCRRASQIKLVGGGGVSTPRSPLDAADVHRARIARGGRSCRRLGHLRHGARLHAGDDPAGDRRRGHLHRAWSSDGRSDGQADVREGRMAEHSAIRWR